MLSNPVFWEGLLFSCMAVCLVGGSAWWLYLSPTPAPVVRMAAPSARQSIVLAALLGLAGIQFITGALWDAGQHLATGQVPGGSDFLWPPHILIYSGFAITLAIALVTLRIIAVPARRAGINDPRAWVRRNPFLGAVALASLYGIFSIPGDALWHALFGIDLTAWSPPHVLLATMVTIVIVSAAALMAQGRSALGRGWADLGVATLLAVGLNLIYIVGVLEWELPRTLSNFVVDNPIWLYPVVGGGLAFFVLILATRLIDWRWAATTTAVLFFLIRVSVTLALAVTQTTLPLPDLPLIFLAGAVVLDWLPWRLIETSWLRGGLKALAYTIGCLGAALPALDARVDLPQFTRSDIVWSVLLTFVVSVILLPLAEWAGLRLAGPAHATAKR